VLIIFSSLAANIIVSFLHALLPVPPVTITDGTGAMTGSCLPPSGLRF